MESWANKAQDNKYISRIEHRRNEPHWIFLQDNRFSQIQ